MNIDFLIKKKHIFKRRTAYTYTPKISINKYCGIYSTNSIRYEFVYFRIFKKLFRKKYFKKNNAILKTKFWLMIKPNFLLTMKSKNSRMGSGVGAYVRVCTIVKPNKPIILLNKYPLYTVYSIITYLKTKLNINFLFNFLKLRSKNCLV